MEVGLPDHLAFSLEQGTFEELMDHFPEVLEEIGQDEFQSKAFSSFVFEHGKHDVRFLYTPVENMSKIVPLRTRHYQRVVALYQQYQGIRHNLRTILRQANVPLLPAGKTHRFYLKADKKKR